MSPNAAEQVVMAFYHLQRIGRVAPGVQYNILHHGNRRTWEKELGQFFEGMPPGYHQHQEYVILWKHGPAHKPYLDCELVELNEFIRAAMSEMVAIAQGPTH